MSHSGGQKNADQSEILQALSVVARAVIGEELFALQNAISDLEATTGRRLEALSREINASADDLRKEMKTQFDLLTQSVAHTEKAGADAAADIQAKALKTAADLERAVKQNADDTAQKLAKTTEILNENLAAAREGVQKDLTTFQQQTVQQYQYVDTQVTAISQELAALQMDHKRLSSVLSNFGRAFTGGGDAPAAAPDITEAPAPRAAVSQTQQIPVTPPAPPQPQTVPQQSKQAHAQNLPGSDDIEQSFDELFKNR